MNLKHFHYTLIELVLSVAIFSIVMLTLVMGLFTVHKNWEKISIHQAAIADKIKLDILADSVIRNAIPFTWPDNDKKAEKPIFQGNNDNLYIASRRWIGDSSTGGLRFVNIFLNNGKLIAKHSRAPIEQAFLNNDSGTEIFDYEIMAENVRSVSFLYAEKENKKLVWLNDWDEEKNENLPIAVQFTIEWIDGTREVWLRRTAGSGIKENIGFRKDYGVEIKNN
jgi:hypothetical protein